MSQKSSTAYTPSDAIRCPHHSSLRFADIAALLKHLNDNHGVSVTQVASGVSKPLKKRQKNKVVVASELSLKHAKSESVAYQCSLCAWTAKKTSDDLTAHMKACHPAVCLLCGVDTGDGVTARKEHLKAVHSSAPTSYQCHLCDPGPILKAHSQYANHMTQAHGLQFCCKSKMCIKSRIVVKSDLPKSNVAKIAKAKPVPLAADLSSQRPTTAPYYSKSDAVRVPTQTTTRVTSQPSTVENIRCYFHPTERFENKQSLREHLDSKHASACLFCGVGLSSASERVPHSEVYHVGHNDRDTKEPCCICGKEFAAVSRRAHLFDKHHQTFCCAQKLCGVGQSAKKTEKPQMELKVDRATALSAEAEFRCVFLHPKRLFSTLPLLLEHVKIDHEGCCMFCGCGSDVNSNAHRNVAHPDRSAVAICICVACGKRLNSHEQLCNHLRETHGQPFCCLQGLCGFQMMQLGSSEGGACNTKIAAIADPTPSNAPKTVYCVLHPGEVFSKRSLWKHLNEQHRADCLCCGMKLGTDEHYQAYHPGHFSSSTTNCTVCGKELPSIALCALHLVKQHTQPFCCLQRLCGVEIARMDGEVLTIANRLEQSTKVSVKEVERTDATSEKMVCCFLHPGIPFPNIKSFTKHLKDIHPLACLFCGEESSTASERKEHRSKYHANCNDVTRLSCSVCAKQLQSHESLSSHLRTSHGKAFCCAEGLCGVPKSDLKLEFRGESTMQKEATTTVVIDPKPAVKSSDGQSQEKSLPPGVLRLVHFVLSQQPERRMTATRLTQTLKDSYGISSWGGDGDLLNLVINGRSSLTIETSDTEEDGDAIWIKIK